MTGREWKPGAVVAVPFMRGLVRGIVTRDGTAISEDGDRWFADTFRNFTDVRPLVVIDPEDADLMERLASAWREQEWADLDDVPMSLDARRMKQTLRSLLAPPKPDEPTGLGAVVEDAEGRLWANLTDPKCSTHTDPWVSVHDPERWVSYADIHPVRVLSSGVDQ